MTTDVSYQYQLDCWHVELMLLGKRLENAKWDDEAAAVSVQVRDLRVRIRSVASELGIYTDDTDTIDALIRKIQDKINEINVQE